MRTALVAFLTILITGAALNDVRLKYFNVEPDGNALAVTWETEQENQVQRFEVFRKAGFDADFVLVGQSNGHGINLQYKVMDDQVYKAGSSDFIGLSTGSRVQQRCAPAPSGEKSQLHLHSHSAQLGQHKGDIPGLAHAGTCVRSS